MSNVPVTSPDPLVTAEAAFHRMAPLANALSEDQFSPLNVDVLSATMTILGVAPRLLSYRDCIAQLPFFDITHLDTLIDRAHAAWFAHVTNLPVAEPADFQEMLAEATALRTTLLSWSVPLVHTGKLDNVTIKHIKDGAGHREIPSDLLALVTLFRSKWGELQGQCGVTEEQLERGAILAPALFATLGRRENLDAPSISEAATRLRRFWTLADHAYDQCRRAIHYLEWGNPQLSEIAPSLRRNPGPRPRATATDAPAEAPTPVAEPLAPSPVEALGEGSGPFMN